MMSIVVLVERFRFLGENKRISQYGGFRNVRPLTIDAA